MGFSEFRCVKSNRRICIADYDGHPALRLHFPIESPAGAQVALGWSGVVTAEAAKQWVELLVRNDESVSLLEIDWWRDEPTVPETYSRHDISRLGDDLDACAKRYVTGTTTLALSARIEEAHVERYYLWGDYALEMDGQLTVGSEVGLRLPAKIALSKAGRPVLEKLISDTFAFPISKSDVNFISDRIVRKLANLTRHYAAEVAGSARPKIMVLGG